MEDSINKFKNELAAFLEFSYNSSPAQDTANRFNDAEKAANDFMDSYVLNSEDLTAGDIQSSAQKVIEEFLNSKIG